MRVSGRDGHLDKLQELLAASVRGEGSIALLSGPVAVGKTTLLHEFVRRFADPGILVLRAAGSRAESTLPFGVMRQLLGPPRSFGTVPPDVQQILETPALAPQQAAEPADWVRYKLCDFVLELAAHSTVILAVDDVHAADDESLRCLGYLARRLSTARLLAVFTERTPARSPHAAVRADFARQPGFQQLRLGPLIRADVAELLADQLGAPVADQLVDECVAASGGSPLLVRALAEDTALATAGDAPEPARSLVVGESFGVAVLDCLHRLDPATADLALRLAVFGPEASAALLAEADADEFGPPLKELEQAGLTTGHVFRRAEARTALSAEVDARTATDLHHRAALLLRDNGAPPQVIAEHIAMAGGVAESWTGESWPADLLQEAATVALAEGEFRTAVRFLDLAHDACADERRKADVLLRSTIFASQVNPSLALRRLPDLKKAVAAGHLGARDGALVLFKNLFWHGHHDEAATVLDLISRVHDGPTEDDDAEIQGLRLWLSGLCPPLHERIFGNSRPDAQAEITPAAVATRPRLQAAAALSLVLTGEDVRSATVAAEHVLEISGLDSTLETIPLALMALFYGDRLSAADAWCGTLLTTARSRGITTWDAVLSSFQSLFLARQGRLRAAEESAAAALHRMSPSGWGMSCVVPLAASVYALTAMGRYQAAQARLDQPVPEALFQTLFGQHYLFARGQFYLATGRLQGALGDFLACGKTLRSWGINSPAVIPWRTAVAETRMRLGDQQGAVPLLQEELALSGNHPRVHGSALRLLAATAEPKRRLALLKQATEQLQASGTRLALAHALGDLGQAYHLLGQSTRARMIVRRAYQLARQCDAEPLCQALLPVTERPSQRPSQRPGSAERDQPAAGQLAQALSDAERRVAELAANGHTNREIAQKLFISISTVEQHMTRILRKLNVSRRSDLPAGLGATAARE